MSAAAIQRLRQALDRRAETGAPVLSFWWRDDDLEIPSLALAEMLTATEDSGIAPGLAAVSGAVKSEAISALDGTQARVMPHGWRHVNHEPAGAKKSEYGPRRAVEERLAEIDGACNRIAALAGTRALLVFTPPWNNIATDLLPHLHRSKAAGVSAYRMPGREPQSASRPRLDTHVDLIDWRGTRQGLSAERLVDLLVPWVKLASVTENPLDSAVGVLSHHLVTRPNDWSAWAPVWRVIASHSASRWVCPETALCMVDGGSDSVTAQGMEAS